MLRQHAIECSRTHCLAAYRGLPKVDGAAVARRTRRLLQQTRQLETTVAERTKALADANRKLDEMAHVDGLTAIGNRGRLDLHLADVHKQCVERGRPLGILAIDADRFKDYNDRHGPLAGDEVLRRLSIEQAIAVPAPIRRLAWTFWWRRVHGDLTGCLACGGAGVGRAHAQQSGGSRDRRDRFDWCCKCCTRAAFRTGRHRCSRRCSALPGQANGTQSI